MQSTKEIKFHPLDLGEFGKTPAGLPLYRVVWADSRTSTLIYQNQRHEMERYAEYPANAGMPAPSGHWILEKWQSAREIYKMTREEFNRFMSDQSAEGATEEWPVDGDYELAHIFAAEVSMEEMRMGIEKTDSDFRNLSDAEKTQLTAERVSKKEAARKAAKAEAIDEILGRDMPSEKVGVIYG
jgi:hypothetical protein